MADFEPLQSVTLWLIPSSLLLDASTVRLCRVLWLMLWPKLSESNDNLVTAGCAKRIAEITTVEPTKGEGCLLVAGRLKLSN